MNSFLWGALVGWACVSSVNTIVSAVRAPRVKVDKEGSWSFPTDTIAQILEIPAERRERFLAEFPSALRHLWALKDKYPLATKPGSVWVDDGKGEFRPHVQNAPEGTEAAFGVRKLDGTPGA